MLRRHAPVKSALEPLRLDSEFQRAAVQPAAVRQPPAQAVIPPGAGQSDGDLRRRGEAVAEGREAVAEPHLQPTIPKVIARFVGRQPRQHPVPQRGVSDAQCRATQSPGQAQPRPPVARRRVPENCTCNPAPAEAPRFVDQQCAPVQLKAQPVLRVGPGEAGADFSADADGVVEPTVSAADNDTVSELRLIAP